MFNISVNDKKNIYRSKPVMNVDTVPKPLTYDYMPEGYPSKSMGLVTLMEEQEVAFSGNNGLMEAPSPVALDIKLGDKLTVVWDGISYNVVVKERVTPGPGGNMVEIMFGNLALINRGESEDYPFVCSGVSDPISDFYWGTADTAASHTIYITTQGTVYQTIDEKFLPKGIIVNVVGTDTIHGNKYLLFDKTDEEINNALNNGSTVKLKLPNGYEIQYNSHSRMFWGVTPQARGSDGITKLAVVSVEKTAVGWYYAVTYVTTSKTS